MLVGLGDVGQHQVKRNKITNLPIISHANLCTIFPRVLKPQPSLSAGLRWRPELKWTSNFPSFVILDVCIPAVLQISGVPRASPKGHSCALLSLKAVSRQLRQLTRAADLDSFLNMWGPIRSTRPSWLRTECIVGKVTIKMRRKVATHKPMSLSYCEWKHEISIIIIHIKWSVRLSGKMHNLGNQLNYYS